MHCLICRSHRGWHDCRDGKLIKFFSIPLGQSEGQVLRREMWLEKIRSVYRKPFPVNHNTRLCSLHFVNVDPFSRSSVPDEMVVDNSILRKANGKFPEPKPKDIPKVQKTPAELEAQQAVEESYGPLPEPTASALVLMGGNGLKTLGSVLGDLLKDFTIDRTVPEMYLPVPGNDLEMRVNVEKVESLRNEWNQPSVADVINLLLVKKLCNLLSPGYEHPQSHVSTTRTRNKDTSPGGISEESNNTSSRSDPVSKGYQNKYHEKSFFLRIKEGFEKSKVSGATEDTEPITDEFDDDNESTGFNDTFTFETEGASPKPSEHQLDRKMKNSDSSSNEIQVKSLLKSQSLDIAAQCQLGVPSRTPNGAVYPSVSESCEENASFLDSNLSKDSELPPKNVHSMKGEMGINASLEHSNMANSDGHENVLSSAAGEKVSAIQKGTAAFCCKQCEEPAIFGILTDLVLHMKIKHGSSGVVKRGEEPEGRTRRKSVRVTAKANKVAKQRVAARHKSSKPLVEVTHRPKAKEISKGVQSVIKDTSLLDQQDQSTEPNKVSLLNPSKVFWCNICNIYIKNLVVMQCHMKKVHSDQVKAYRKTKASLKKYVRKRNLFSKEEKEGTTDPGSSLRMFKCGHCPLYFKSSYLRYRHGSKVHPDLIKRTEKGGDKSVTCEFCLKVFKDRGLYRSHVQHRHTEGKAFMCQLCPKTFKSNKALNAHLRAHEEGDLICDICGKTFYGKFRLNAHRKVHEERGYTCEKCGKVLHSMYSLRDHLLYHEGAKNYACDACGKRFVTLKNLGAHKRVHLKAKSKAEQQNAVTASETPE